MLCEVPLLVWAAAEDTGKDNVCLRSHLFGTSVLDPLEVRLHPQQRLPMHAVWSHFAHPIPDRAPLPDHSVLSREVAARLLVPKASHVRRDD